MSSHYIEEDNLSYAWARVLREVSAKGKKEVVPLIVSLTGFDQAGAPFEEAKIRAPLEALLRQEGLQSIDTVASTIFPQSFWNPKAGRAQLFQRYQRAFPKLQRASPKNRRGIYFQRMTSGGIAENPNQLDFVISTYMARKGVRRSVLQVSTFDPSKDHTASALFGFPCLQHVTFAPVDGTLSVNAFYASQFVVERAYGNYLGLCRLGHFVAHEMGLTLSRVTCFTGISELDMSKAKIAPLQKIIDQIVTP